MDAPTNVSLVSVPGPPPVRLCWYCSARLGDLGEHDCCAECGLPVLVSTQAAQADAALDERGVVAGDTACHKCGYNLRGLAREGRCPECATPVSASIRADFLCFAEPAYIKKLARGSRWVLFGLNFAAASLLAMIISGIGVAVLGAADSTWAALPLFVAGLAIVALPIGGVIYLIGVWLITAPEVRVFETQKRDRARRLVRVALLASFLAMGLNYVVRALVPPMQIIALVALTRVAFSALGAVGVWAYFHYVRGIAERLPVDELARRAHGVARGFAITLGTIVFFYAVSATIAWGPALVRGAAPIPVVFRGAASPTSVPAPGTGSNPTTMSRLSIGGSSGGLVTAWIVASSCMSSLAVLAAVVYFFRAVRLHTRLKKALGMQAVLAEQFWAAAHAGPAGLVMLPPSASSPP